MSFIDKLSHNNHDEDCKTCDKFNQLQIHTY